MLQYNNPKLVEAYKHLNHTWSLWSSEHDVFLKYGLKNKPVLDIGCGAGRIAIGLKELGFSYVTALDCCPNMISAATSLTPNEYYIHYICEDIVHFTDTQKYQLAIFGYNGLMGIKGEANRLSAVKNIYKLLEVDGYLIFTTHISRTENNKYFAFWKEREEQYLKEGRDVCDDDFADLYVEDKGISVYQHFSTDEEICAMLDAVPLKLVDTFSRDSVYREADCISTTTNDCQFWITQKE